MSRVTRTLSFEDTDLHLFEKVKAYAKKQSPKVSASQMHIHIIKDFFERDKILKEMQKQN